MLGPSGRPGVGVGDGVLQPHDACRMPRAVGFEPMPCVSAYTRADTRGVRVHEMRQMRRPVDVCGVRVCRVRRV